MTINFLCKTINVFIIMLVCALIFIGILFVLNIIWDLIGWIFKLKNFKEIDISSVVEYGDIYVRKDLFSILLHDSFIYLLLLIPFGLLTTISMWVKSKAFKNYKNFELL